jgi:transcriptional regulator with XRE-family HTH domain
MRTPEEISEIIIGLLKEQKSNAHQMLKKCGYNTSLVNDLKKGQMPAADKIANIAKFLGVSADFLLDSTSSKNPQANEIEIKNHEKDLIFRLREIFHGGKLTALHPEEVKNIADMAQLIAGFNAAKERR